MANVSPQRITWSEQYSGIPHPSIAYLSPFAQLVGLQLSRRGSTSTSAVAAPAAFESIKALGLWLSIRDYIRVSSFLTENSGLVPVLLAACVRIQEDMPDALRPILELIEDPESGTRKLFLLIPTKLPVKEARQILRKLDETWWLDAAQSVGSRVNIDLEFV